MSGFSNVVNFKIGGPDVTKISQQLNALRDKKTIDKNDDVTFLFNVLINNSNKIDSLERKDISFIIKRCKKLKNYEQIKELGARVLLEGTFSKEKKSEVEGKVDHLLSSRNTVQALVKLFGYLPKEEAQKAAALMSKLDTSDLKDIIVKINSFLKSDKKHHGKDGKQQFIDFANHSYEMLEILENMSPEERKSCLKNMQNFRELYPASSEAALEVGRLFNSQKNIKINFDKDLTKQIQKFMMQGTIPVDRLRAVRLLSIHNQMSEISPQDRRELLEKVEKLIYKKDQPELIPQEKLNELEISERIDLLDILSRLPKSAWDTVINQIAATMQADGTMASYDYEEAIECKIHLCQSLSSLYGCSPDFCEGITNKFTSKLALDNILASFREIGKTADQAKMHEIGQQAKKYLDGLVISPDQKEHVEILIVLHILSDAKPEEWSSLLDSSKFILSRLKDPYLRASFLDSAYKVQKGHADSLPEFYRIAWQSMGISFWKGSTILQTLSSIYSDKKMPPLQKKEISTFVINLYDNFENVSKFLEFSNLLGLFADKYGWPKVFSTLQSMGYDDIESRYPEFDNEWDVSLDLQAKLNKINVLTNLTEELKDFITFSDKQLNHYCQFAERISTSKSNYKDEFLKTFRNIQKLVNEIPPQIENSVHVFMQNPLKALIGIKIENYLCQREDIVANVKLELFNNASRLLENFSEIPASLFDNEVKRLFSMEPAVINNTLFKCEKIFDQLKEKKVPISKELKIEGLLEIIPKIDENTWENIEEQAFTAYVKQKEKHVSLPIFLEFMANFSKQVNIASDVKKFNELIKKSPEFLQAAIEVDRKDLLIESLKTDEGNEYFSKNFRSIHKQFPDVLTYYPINLDVGSMQQQPGLLSFIIGRNYLTDQSIDTLMNLGHAIKFNLKKIPSLVRVTYLGEKGVDAGGLSRNFFTTLFRNLETLVTANGIPKLLTLNPIKNNSIYESIALIFLYLIRKKGDYPIGDFFRREVYSTLLDLSRKEALDPLNKMSPLRHMELLFKLYPEYGPGSNNFKKMEIEKIYSLMHCKNREELETFLKSSPNFIENYYGLYDANVPEEYLDTNKRFNPIKIFPNQKFSEEKSQIEIFQNKLLEEFPLKLAPIHQMGQTLYIRDHDWKKDFQGNAQKLETIIQGEFSAEKFKGNLKFQTGIKDSCKLAFYQWIDRNAVTEEGRQKLRNVLEHITGSRSLSTPISIFLDQKRTKNSDIFAHTCSGIIDLPETVTPEGIDAYLISLESSQREGFNES